jgi:protein TilB
MPRLTEQLLRKRAEHNDKCLTDLEEVALHQQELEGIDSLEGCCRHIKILLLQNNIIPKMEGLSKLRELEYLNLCLNNISKIEGIDGCESLNKLDMTVNFVDVENLQESVYNMKANMMLEDLYLTGNPCEDWPGFRPYVMANLPQLKQLDGKLILPTDRIKARQQLPGLQADLERVVQLNLARKASEAGQPVSEGAYTIESRNEMYLEMAEQKEEKEKNERRRMGTEEKPKREVPGVYNIRGEIRQCNEGHYDFNLDEFSEPGKLIFELSVPKYLDTSQLDVDVNPLYVRCVVKDKVTQLKLPAEVLTDAAKVQRSRITGLLKIEMPLLDTSHLRAPRVEAPPALQPLQPADSKSSTRGKASIKGYNGSGVVAGMYVDPKKVSKKKDAGGALLQEVRTTYTRTTTSADDDDDEVPPLIPVK